MLRCPHDSTRDCIPIFLCGVFSCVSRVGLQLFKASHSVSESCYRIREFSGVEKMVCSCVDDNGKLWRIIPGVAGRGEKLERFLLFLKYSRLFLSCTCKNLSFFMLMNKTTCCYSVDDVVLVFLVRARVCVCVCVCIHLSGHVIPSRVHLHILKPVSFSLSNLPCACVCVCVRVCVCVFRFAFASRRLLR